MIWYRVEWSRSSCQDFRVSFPDLAENIQFSFQNDEQAAHLAAQLASEIIDKMIEYSYPIPRSKESTTEVELRLDTSMRLALYWANDAVNKSCEEGAMGLAGQFPKPALDAAYQKLAAVAERYVSLLDEANSAHGFPVVIVVEPIGVQAA